MRVAILCGVVLLLSVSSQTRDARTVSSMPDQFEIGRRTFFDFGPPFNFYDLSVIRPNGNGSSVERISLTPAADECLAPAKIEVASAQMSDSPATLLGSMNPCAIPEKELKPDDCKHCQRFSGADVVLRVQCGKQVRLIPSHIFEDYWFNPAAKPPKTTFSLLQLLKRIDDAIGRGVMDKPMFDFGGDQSSPAKLPDSAALRELSAGEFDELFKGGGDKPSDLYSSAQKIPPAPSVRLVSTVPYEPESSVLPNYPPIARAASVEGQVAFTAGIDSNGTPTNVVFESGNPLLQSAVRGALYSWKFPRDTNNQQIHGTVEFLLNCHRHQP